MGLTIVNLFTNFIFMPNLIEVYRKWILWKGIDRIGPDILRTHWKLYFRSSMVKLCKKKFKAFDLTSDFRPGAYAIGCSQIVIGKRVVIRPETMLHAETATSDISIVIEDDVLIGSGVHIYVENHRFDRIDIPIIDQGHYPSKPVILRKGCWIGANSTILPGVEIGENSVIGAGSIVTRSIPKEVVAAGNPAKIIKTIC
jgi:hypothetical protein